MDCLRSFIVGINQVGTFTGAGISTWNVPALGNSYFSAIVQGLTTYEIKGFKNINIFGVSISGHVISQASAPIGKCLVSDWAFVLTLDGQLPIIGGVVSPNFWSLSTDTTQTKIIALSKNTPEIIFKDPITSVKIINFNQLRCQGEGAETANTISLDYDLTFTFYYKFEGE
jgi:hypothetical protein